MSSSEGSTGSSVAVAFIADAFRFEAILTVAQCPRVTVTLVINVLFPLVLDDLDVSVFSSETRACELGSELSLPPELYR